VNDILRPEPRLKDPVDITATNDELQRAQAALSSKGKRISFSVLRDAMERLIIASR
jgi:hypothetical protein